jgi:hypothetical protein
VRSEHFIESDVELNGVTVVVGGGDDASSEGR